MPMYNLLEYSKNYSKKKKKKKRDVFGITIQMNQVTALVVWIITNYSAKDTKSFYYKSSITGKLEGNNTEKKSWNCCAMKTFKPVLENSRYAIN